MDKTYTNEIAALGIGEQASVKPVRITIISFGYKEAPPPPANIVFDVRFLKNPYWVDELRPLTGLDKQVQDYVLNQSLAQDFLKTLTELLGKVIPELSRLSLAELTVALGCTGGQHRSCALVESLAQKLSQILPSYPIYRQHRELEISLGPSQATNKKNSGTNREEFASDEEEIPHKANPKERK
jgi:UPF0042 nucleotide-binding protein